MDSWMEYAQFAAVDALVRVPCPRCDGYWFQDVDEQGLPYTCFYCGNDSIKICKYEVWEDAVENT